MRFATGSLIFLLLAVFQSTLVSFGEFRGAKPDLLFIFLVYFALFFGRREGMIIGLFAGLFLDLYEPRYLGLHAFIYTLIGFFIGSLAERLYRERILSQFLTLFFASLVGNILLFLILTRPALIVQMGILQSLYTSVVGIALFFLFTRIFERWIKIS